MILPTLGGRALAAAEVWFFSAHFSHAELRIVMIQREDRSFNAVSIALIRYKLRFQGPCVPE